MPSPPINISRSIIIFPNPDQYVAVTSTVNPVTVIAEVAVNKASMKGVIPPAVLDCGRPSKPVPINIRIVKREKSIAGDPKALDLVLFCEGTDI